MRCFQMGGRSGCEVLRRLSSRSSSMKISEDETTDHSLYQTPVQAWPMLANTDASEGAVPGSTCGLQLQVQNQGLR